MGTQRHLLIVIPKPTMFSYAENLIRAAVEAGMRVSLRYGPTEQKDQLRAAFDAFDAPIEARCVTDPPLINPRRKLLALIAGWAVYRRAGQYDSRYVRRLERTMLKHRSLRSMKFLVEPLRPRRAVATVLLRACRGINRVVPVDRAIRQDVRRSAPSFVVVLSHNHVAKRRVWKQGEDDPSSEYLEAAKREGVPTAAMVLSWDNLTTKGTFLRPPDRIFAWNSFHATAARERHLLPQRSIREVGCVRLEDLRGRPHGSDAGAPDDRSGPPWPNQGPVPRILYLGSSRGIAPDETSLVAAVCDAVSAHGLDWQIVVRPHPSNYAPFVGFRHDRAVIWPPQEWNDLARRGHDSLVVTAKSAICAMGINTSGFLDAALLGLRTATFLRADIDRDGLPSLHLRAAVDLGIATPVQSPEEAVLMALDILHRRVDRSYPPEAIAAALGRSDELPSRRTIEELIQLDRDGQQA